MSDENVGGLVAKWREAAKQADAAQGKVTKDGCAYAVVFRDCADELEAALSAHGQPVVWVNPDDLANPHFVSVNAAKEGHEDKGRHYTLPLYAHGQPVDYSPALHSVLSYIAYGECDEEGLHPGLFATVKEKIDKLRSKPVVGEDAQEAIADILNRMESWSKAYPVEVFHEPTKEERDWLHKTRPGLMDCIAASMGRHMAKRIADDLAKLTAALTGATK